MTVHPFIPLLLAGLASVAAAVPPGYAKVWQDTFDQAALDPANWTIGLRDPATGDLVPGAHGDFLLNSGYAGYVTPDDVVVANGTLSLLNQQRSIQGSSPPGNFDYTSGWVMSMHKVHFNKGYLEWRARFPTGDKVWPALWLIAEDLVWGPEWDCFEYFGYRADVGYDIMGAHLLRDEWPNQKWSTFWVRDFDRDYDADAWHVYGFEWTDTHAKWFVDGVEVRHLDNTFGASWPDEEMYIVMNNGVKTDSPDTSTAWPNALEIDYVALYEKCAGDLACPHSPLISRVWIEGGDVRVEAANLLPGTTYHLRRGHDISLPTPFPAIVETRLASAATETFTDPGAPAPAGKAFYVITE